jgi:signal transduction histidine kinase
VRVVATVRGNDAVSLFVADNGPGIPLAAAHRMFEPFARLYAGELSHNGIDLSIVRRIAERHGGRAWAENAPQGGAVFWLEVPGVPR